jgi:hypothetical protein
MFTHTKYRTWDNMNVTWWRYEPLQILLGGTFAICHPDNLYMYGLHAYNVMEKTEYFVSS